MFFFDRIILRFVICLQVVVMMIVFVVMMFVVLVFVQFFGLSLLLSGGNQKVSIIQYIGLVEVCIDYLSFDVIGLGGQDCCGQIWGQFVLYGFINFGFGNGNLGFWCVGVNENMVFIVFYDVEIEGKVLFVGIYGLYMIVDESEWMIIFLNNLLFWGSFFYDLVEDVLCVLVKFEKVEYCEWFIYDVFDCQQMSVMLVMYWEELCVLFEVSVFVVNDIYLMQI